MIIFNFKQINLINKIPTSAHLLVLGLLELSKISDQGNSFNRLVKL